MTHIIAETIRRWRLPLVCLAWMFTLLGLMMRGAYESFLAASFLPIIILSIAILLPLAFLALLRRTVPRFGVREALATAILLLPLAYIHHSKKTTLGSGAFSTRYVGSGISESRGMSPVRGGDNGGTSLLTVFLETDKYAGKKITVLGMLAKNNAQVERLLNKAYPLVFRFVMTCCAADATPIALVLENGEAVNLKDDDWIEASGRLRVRTVGGQDLLALEEASIRPVPAPEQPYLYMQWGVF